jgi:glutathione synthase/RimK-type ligase-like ATP-grasp enzyme
MVLIAIHRGSDTRDGYADGWAECLVARGVDVRWLDLTAQDALHQVQGCDGVLWRRTRNPEDKMVYQILNVIELYLGIPVFPNYRSLWHHSDKLAQYYLLQAAGVPMPETWIFWDKERAREWALQTDYPKVFKLSTSGNSRGVVLVSCAEAACRLIDCMFGPGLSSEQIDQHATGGIPRNWTQLSTLIGRCKAAACYIVQQRPPDSGHLEQGYVYFQEFVPGNVYKTKISVIGARACGSVWFNRPNDFRSGMGKRDYDPLNIDLKCVQMAFDISERLGFHMMVYDFLLHHGEPVVLEITIQYPKPRHGYWKRNLEWISEPMSPQEAQVEAFLHSICSGNRKSGTIPEHARTRMACPNNTI